MKISNFFQSVANPATHQTMRFVVLAMIVFCSMLSENLNAQASLSIQGILKKSNGIAVEDGTYNVTFKLYAAPVGGTALWTETQSNVEVSSGIYSTLLGNSVPLNIPFNQIYYLGVTIGSSELTPRIQLTSAPYALALIGGDNLFPSSGLVIADSIKVNGGVLATGGVPGINGANHNGYAFSGNNGDKDSGLFSTAEGKVSLYVNNTEVLAATPGNVAVTGNLSSNNVTLQPGGKISYSNLSDWRLVSIDNFTSGGANGWHVYNPVGVQHVGWNSGSNNGAAPIAGGVNNFEGAYLHPASNNQVLKKYYDLSTAGEFSEIKVKFKYHFLESWDPSTNDRAWAAFAEQENGTQIRLSWSSPGVTLNTVADFQHAEFNSAASYDSDNYPDYSSNGEMTAHKVDNTFWVFFGAALDENDDNESYGVGMIEVWVR